MTEPKLPSFKLDAEKFLTAMLGYVGVIGSPPPDSVPSPRVTEASSGPGVPSPHPHAGAAANGGA